MSFKIINLLKLNSKIVKLQLFGLLLAFFCCSPDQIQAQAAQPNVALIQDIQNNQLTQAGSDINKGYVNVFDANHKVPLTYALQSTTSNAFTFATDLLNSGNPSSAIADPTVVDTGAGSVQKTILMSALESANEEVLVNSLSNTSSPMYTTIIQTLLSQLKNDGISLLIDVNAKDLNGKTALDYAVAAKNFYAPRAAMTLLLTPGIKPPASLALSPIQKNTQQLWADLITPSTNLVLAPNIVNPNFNLTKVLADINAEIDPNAQDNTGTTALMYIAQALAATPTPAGTLADNLNSVLTNLLTLPNINLNLSNLGQPVGLNNNNSNFNAMATGSATPFGYPIGLSAGGSAGFLTTNSALNNATSAQVTAITTLFNNLNNGTFDTYTTGSPSQTLSVLTSANINYRDPNSYHWTPLIYAITSGVTANVTSVLSFNNVALNFQDDNGETALMYAAKATSNALVNIQALLLNSLVNVNIRSNSGKTALMYALVNGQSLALINALLAAPNLDLNITDNYNNSALSYAYTSQNSQQVAIINAITNSINTQLIAAIHNGDLAMVKNTISAIANCKSCQCTGCPTLTTIDMVDSNGLTPLMHAAKSLNDNIDFATKVPVAYEIVQTLIDLGSANPTATDNNGLTPLLYAAQSLNNTIDKSVTPIVPVVNEIINYLIQGGADITTLDKQNNSALSYAQKTSNTNKTAIVNFIQTATNTQFFEDLIDTNSNLPVITLATIKNDLTAGADINAIDKTNNYITPLMYAAQSSNMAVDTSVTPNMPAVVEIINYLLNNPKLNSAGNVFAQDSNGYTAYYYATQNSANNYQNEITQALVLGATPQLFTDLQNKNCNIANIEDDLSAGASVILTDSKKNTAYYYAQQLPSTNTDKPTIIQAIIATATNQLFSDLQNTTTPPTLAIIQADLTAGASVIATDSNNNTAFYYAQQLPTTNLAKSTIVSAIINTATNQLFSDLQNTTTPPTLAIIQADLTAGASAIATDSKKNAALYYAQQLPASNVAKTAIVSAIKTAVITSATTQLFNDLESSTITLAAIQADLTAGANVAALDIKNHAPLYYAQQLPKTNLARTAIIQAIATAQLFNDLQNTVTPPTLAVIQADITAGANIVAPDSYSKTALLYANKLPSSNTDKSAIIQAIIAAATTQLFSDLQNTITPPTLAVIQADLTAGANVNLIDKKNKTPLMYAQLLSNSNTAKAAIIKLIQTAAAGSVTNQLFSDLQNSAVTLAEIQADLAAGANVNAIDPTNNNVTPLMYAVQSQVNTIDTTVSPNVPVVIEIIQILIDAMQKTGTQNSIYTQDSNKHTALYYAQQLTNNNQAAIETVIATAQLFYDLQNPKVTLAIVQADIAANANVAAQDVSQKTALDYANLLPVANIAKATIITALKAAATPQLLLDLQNPNCTLAEIQADMTAGANINYLDVKNNNVTPLMYAAQSQNSLVDTTAKTNQPVIIEIINYILSNPALNNIGNVFAQDSNGNTAYYYATQSGNPNQAAIEAIFVAVATPQLLIDLQNSGITLKMVNADIAAGANVNATNSTGTTPLMYIAQSQNKLIDQTVSPNVPVVLEVINALINANANSATLDNNGHTALYYARNNWNNSTIFQTAPYKAQIITALTPPASVSLGKKQTAAPIAAAPNKLVLKKPRTKVKTIKRVNQVAAKLPKRPTQKISGTKN